MLGSQVLRKMPVNEPGDGDKNLDQSRMLRADVPGFKVRGQATAKMA